MNCLILASCDHALQRRWQDRLAARLRAQGHEVMVTSGLSWLHHISLRTALRLLELASDNWTGRLAIWESDTWPLDDRWAAWVEAEFEADPALALVAAQHGWLRFPRATRLDVVTADSDLFVGRQWMPLDRNAAAWWAVLDLDRLRVAGLRAGDLDWEPTRFRVLLDEAGRSRGAVGGDTGARVVPQLEAAGLGAELWPVRPWPCGWGCYVVRPGTEDWVMFHHFFGRQIGHAREVDVMHHRLRAEDVTESALRFMETHMEGNDG